MCVNDWRLGRLISTKITAVTPGIGGTFLVPANMQRVGIIIQSFPISTTLVRSPLIDVDGVRMFMLVSTLPILSLNLAQNGSIVTKSFLITTPVEATPIGITEFSLPESYIAAGIEEFSRRYIK